MTNATDLLAKADKKANTTSSGFSSFFGSSSQKYEEARDLYVAAANAFTLEKSFKQSGNCHTRAAEMALKGEEPDDAAGDYWNASKSYKKVNPELAIAALQQTIELLKQKGRFRQAADREKEIATIYVQEGGDLAAALQAYEQAGELYSAEDATATANGCYKEAADLAATLEQYSRAIGHYERVAIASLNNPMTKYSVKEYYFKSGLCWLASGDVVSTRRALDSYYNADATFDSTREAKFLSSIVDAFDLGDSEAFVGAVQEFDRLTKLDNWKTAILLKIKQGIAEEPGLT